MNNETSIATPKRRYAKRTDGGRPIQIAKTLYWDFVPDTHRCKGCGKTKHQGVNFRVNVRKDFKNVEQYCNSCRLDRKQIKMEAKNNTVKIEPNIKEKINLYFKKGNK